MAGVNKGGIRVEGSLVHLDAGPARLLAQLRDAASDTFVTALTADGASRHERLPAAVRRARYELAGRSVEATPAAAFVAVTTEGGRLIVAALEGEIVVVTSTGNRTAVAAHETLVSEAPDAEPRVVVTSALPGDDRVAVDAAIGEVSEALVQPMPEVEAIQPVESEPVAAAAEPEPEPEPEPVPAAAATTDVEESVTEEEKVERRGVAIGIAVGAVVAVAALVMALLLLPGGDQAAGPRSTTTAAPQTTAEATTTTGAATTATTAAPTTTTAAAVASYDVRPEACRQSGDTVTFTGEIANNADDAWRFTVSAVFRDAEGRVLDRGRTEVGPVGPGATETFTVTGDAPRPAAACDVDRVETTPAG